MWGLGLGLVSVKAEDTKEAKDNDRTNGLYSWELGQILQHRHQSVKPVGLD